MGYEGEVDTNYSLCTLNSSKILEWRILSSEDMMKPVETQTQVKDHC